MYQPIRDYAQPVPAAGHADARDKRPKVAVRFDADTFGNIRLLAEAQGVSFAEQVRRLVERGFGYRTK